MPRRARKAELDEKDRLILEFLMEDGRRSFRDMARALGMSDVAVRKRVLKLEKMGVILGYTALVDPRALGYSVVSLTGVDVEPGELKGLRPLCLADDGRPRAHAGDMGP